LPSGGSGWDPAPPVRPVPGSVLPVGGTATRPKKTATSAAARVSDPAVSAVRGSVPSARSDSGSQDRSLRAGTGLRTVP